MTKTPPPPTPAELPGWTAICWLLFSSFTFYVTFVQYALLRRATLVLHWAEKDLTPGFALLAICGIAGSLAAGYAIDRRKPFTDHLAQAAAGISGVVAVVAVAMMQVTSRLLLLALFAPLGFALGLLIVLLLTLMVTRLPLRILGIFGGFTAGAIYLVSNLLAVFSDNPDKIGMYDAILVASNVVVVFLFMDSLRNTPSVPAGCDTTSGRMVKALLPLAAVVFADTALFVLVSRAPGENAILATSGDWFANGVIHFLAAAFAGLFYVRVGWKKLNAVAAAALVMLIAAYLTHRFTGTDLRGPILGLYGAVVGIYTVALFTVFGEEAPRAHPATGIAWGMVLVGWVASPAGIALGTALVG
ncbi:MAG: hypothetical protein P9L99_00630 [Candidatus Lernaella stagnicola]|nr:hypothetical protein [Candidatus Lernaella stagnicola]